MWPPNILQTIAPYLITDNTKLGPYFVQFIKKCLWPIWTSELLKISSLLDFRDYAEDTLAQLKASVSSEGLQEEEGITALYLILKSTPVSLKRRQIVCEYLEQGAQTLKNKFDLKSVIRPDFVQFILESELEAYFATARELCLFRPLLKASPETIEKIIKSINSLGQSLTLKDLKDYEKDLGLSTLLPVLALYKANEVGDTEDIFLNTPLPRMFGAPLSIRKDLERTCDYDKIAKATSKNAVSFHNVVLAGSGFLAWTKNSGGQENSKWTVKELPRAHLVAPLPGLKGHVWTLQPKNCSAAIYRLEPSFHCVMEFDLPQEAEDIGEPNWIDCQRDSEGALVLLWANLNALTGGIIYEKMVAIDEESIVSNDSKQINFLNTIAEMPNRLKPGVRIDWRDHGNLLSVHHTVKDTTVTERHWTHTYEVVFAATMLMSMTTDMRPIEAVYGSPLDVILLSPLSSKQALQHWKLNLNEKKYELVDSKEGPKRTGKVGQWKNVCLYF